MARQVRSPLHSCLYQGFVSHQRKAPAHRFRYKTSWLYIDLDEMEQMTNRSRLMGRSRFGAMAFRRRDHFGNAQQSMRNSVVELIRSKCGLELSGRICVLTQLSHFGFFFSPLSIFYCFDTEEKLVASVAEVNNTPWGEAHCYVLWAGNQDRNSPQRYSHPKEFHVSPFMDMDSNYRWNLSPPNDQLRLSLGCEKQGANIFQAHLILKRRELTDTALAMSLLRRPVAGANILLSIYYQALRLWMKRCQFFPHPQKQTEQRRLTERASHLSNKTI